MKKALSLALALALCLGLTVPAMAAQTGDKAVTVTDPVGLSITLELSNAIVKTETMAVGAEDETDVTVYYVPSGTTITPSIPGASWKEGIFGGEMLCNSDFVGTIPTGERWDGEYGVSFAVNRYDENAGEEPWVEVESLTGGTTLSDGTWLISCGHFYSAEGTDFVGTGRQISNIYFCVSSDSAVPTEPEPTTPVDPEPTEPVTPPAEEIPAEGTAYASTQTVTVDGKAVEFQMYALKDENGNLTNYIKLRDMAYVLNGTKAQFSVGYDGTISLTTGEAYQAGGTEMTTPFSGDRAYKGGAQTVKVNGEAVSMTAITLTDDAGGGYNYFKLRDLGKTLGFYVGYSNEAGIYIDSAKPYSE